MEELSLEDRWRLEARIRATRKEERRRMRMHDVPTSQPGREPTIREIMAYCQEKTELMFGNKEGGIENDVDLERGAERRDATGKEDGFVFPRAKEAHAYRMDEEEASYVAKKKAEERIRKQNLAIAETRARMNPSEEERKAKLEAETKKYVAQANPTGTCAECGWSGTRFRCSKCKVARYCSAACQKRHWTQRHRLECGCDRD